MLTIETENALDYTRRLLHFCDVPSNLTVARLPEGKVIGWNRTFAVRIVHRPDPNKLRQDFYYARLSPQRNCTNTEQAAAIPAMSYTNRILRGGLAQSLHGRDTSWKAPGNIREHKINDGCSAWF